jgi:type IV pilus assembly protein PilX
MNTPPQVRTHGSHALRRVPRLQAHQRGVVMLFGLLALVIMMIGAVAMIRSMNTQLFNAGNLGLKRDLANQAERATAVVLQALGGTGALSLDVTRQQHAVANNYSATLLPSNAQGFPQALIEDASFGAVATAANDITDTAQGITVRYVLDRMCASTGEANTTHCTINTTGSSGSGNGSEGSGPGLEDTLPTRVVYRLSIRVDGPRRTQAFFQTTLNL